MASMSPAVAMRGTGKPANRSTAAAANAANESILSARARYSPAPISWVKPPTTAVMGWMDRPPTAVHSSLPSAFRPSAPSNSAGSLSASGNTLFCPTKSGAASTNRCVAWFCRYEPVHQKLAQGPGAGRDLHAEDALDGLEVGDHVAGRADAADARGDVGHLAPAAAAHHALEQARRLHHVHLHGLHGAVLDDHVHVAVALHPCDMVHVYGGFRHGSSLLARR